MDGFPWLDDFRICGKISHVNNQPEKSGIVSHAGRGYNFAMNANSSPSKPASHQPIAADRLHAPLARLLRPLVRLCIRSGMTFPALAQLLRELFVNVAEHDFALDGKEQTDSRVSLLTGIHRKEVARLRGAGTPVNETPATLSRTSAIIARWMAAPEFTDKAGDPLPCRAPPMATRRRSRRWSNRSPRMCGRARCWTNGSTANLSPSTRMKRSCWSIPPSFRAATTIANGTISAAICTTISRRRPTTCRRSAALPRARGALRRPVAQTGQAPRSAFARTRHGCAEDRQPRSQPRGRQGQGRRRRWNFGVYIYYEAPDGDDAKEGGPS